MELENYEDIIYLLRKHSGVGFKYDQRLEDRTNEKMETKSDGGTYNVYSNFFVEFYKVVQSIADKAGKSIEYLDDLKKYPDLVAKKIEELKETELKLRWEKTSRIRNKERNVESMADYLIRELAGDNIEAHNILMNLMEKQDGWCDIIRCQKLGFTGSTISVVFNECCGRNYDNFRRTLCALINGWISKKDIERNLSLDNKIPFLDDRISYGENIVDELYVQCEVFRAKLKEALKKEKVGKKSKK